MSPILALSPGPGATGRFLVRCLLLSLMVMSICVVRSDGASMQVGSQPLQQIYRQSVAGVVLVRQLDAEGDWTSFGSGFIVSSSGVIVTNHHVIEPSKKAVRLSVELANGDEFTDVRVIYAESRRDFAVLSVKALNLQALRIGDSDDVQVGDQILAIGNPEGLTFTFTQGIVSSVRTDSGRGYRYIQHQAPISHGSSGGPLLNLDGDVIGINTFSFAAEGAQNLNGAVPINYVKPYFDDPSNTTWPQWARAQAPPAGISSSTTASLSTTWTVTNSCESGDVYLRFFEADSQDNTVFVWPASTPTSDAYLLKREETRTYTLSNCHGAKICYGAQTTKGKKLEWGSKLDGKSGCESCCVTCGATKRTNLICGK